jgi:hypothetical protein
MTKRPWPLTVLMLLLIGWEPATFALYAAGAVERVMDRGALSVAVLLARVVVTAIGVAAGLSIYNDRPWALAFARLAVVLSAGATMLAALTRALPNNAPPGLYGPVVAIQLAVDAGWVIYLTWAMRKGP